MGGRGGEGARGTEATRGVVSLRDAESFWRIFDASMPLCASYLPT